MINDIAQIAFEHIVGDYHWGKYGDFKVIINIQTRYINATQLCKLATSKNGEPKQFRFWKQNAETIEYMDEVSSSLGIPRDNLFAIVAGGQNVDVRGTYAHPDLIPYIASWASPKFAHRVTKIVNAYFVLEHKRSIAELRQQLDRITERDNNHVKQLKEIHAIIQEPKSSLYHLRERIMSIIDNVVGNNTKLIAATEDRVPKCQEDCKNEVFAVYQNPSTLQCKMIRRQQGTLQSRVKSCSERGFTRLVYYNDSPNAVNLGSRLRSKLPADLGRMSRCTITLTNNGTIEDLLQFIRGTEAEKRNV